MGEGGRGEEAGKTVVKMENKSINLINKKIMVGWMIEERKDEQMGG